ncbi:MAG: UDP-glucose 6-dehydrogenase [Planctomycetota bacterium]|nr:MAG: UDP-glucose 6-dehydrogenase [Planctomycetota bacterium]
MRITVFGTGYVGTVTGTCFADLGNELVCVDVDGERVARLNAGDPVIYETGLRDLLQRNLEAGRLRFTTDAASAVRHGELIFVCVGTPPRSSGEADLSQVVEVARTVGRHMQEYKIIVNKSTVPVGTYDVVRRAVREAQTVELPFDVVSNPEFLREGQAIQDFQNPERIVIGTDSERAREALARLYRPIARTNRPIFFTTIPSAELIKYASNAMLATRISFMNELSHLCEAVGANILEVARGMGLDSRIGPRFLHAGCGYGGSCFPKDVKALAQVMEQHGLTSNLLRAVDYINERQKRAVVQKLKRVLPQLDGRTIAVWGLSFKPRTDDMREAPSLRVIEDLLREYARVRAYDPEARQNARQLFGDAIEVVDDAYEAVAGADALVLLTEWDEFRQPDLLRVRDRMAGRVIVDGRNVLSRAEVEALGFTYIGFGT